MGDSKAAYFILNVIRFLNITAILSAILASTALLVKTADLTRKIGWFNVFDLAEKVLIILFALFILLTETPRLLRGYFARAWPCFSYQSGFVALSFCLLFLGCDVLSYLTKDKTDKKQLGGDFYRMVQAAGCMCIVMATINLPASFILQDRRKGLSARQVRAFKAESFLQQQQA